MLVPQTAEYALRIMAHIAMNPDDRFFSTEHLAESADIPRHYLSKILRRLVKAGLLTSQSGPGGGVRLTRSKSDITFEEILQAANYQSDPEHCAFGWGQCDHSLPCPLHSTWKKLKENFHSWAKNHTLEDIDTKQISVLTQRGAG